MPSAAPLAQEFLKQSVKITINIIINMEALSYFFIMTPMLMKKLLRYYLLGQKIIIIAKNV